MKMLKRVASAAVIAMACAAPALGDDDMVRVKSDGSVEETVARLTAAVEKAGATVFLVVDHAAGAESVGVTLRPTTLVVLGSPKIGAPAMLEAQTLGLSVPLRVLAYEDAAGDVWLIYEDPEEMAEDYGLDEDHPSVKKMQGALKKFTAIAAGG